MYAGTIVNYIDLSDTPKLPLEQRISPFYMTVFSSDKGTEEPIVIEGTDFFNMYGSNPSFERHGQPLLQAANIINSGGKLYAKRVAATDATLANITLFANVLEVEKQKTNAAGLPLYKGADGKETTEATTTPEGGEATPNQPIMVKSAKIKYTIETVEKGNDIKVINTSQAAKLVESTDQKTTDSIFPLLTISDNGRGISKKKIRIVPDYVFSKNQDIMLYNFSIIEENTILATDRISLNPDGYYLKTNMSIKNKFNGKKSQVKVEFIEECFSKFIDNIASITGKPSTEIIDIDLLFGADRKGKTYDGIIIDDDSFDLQYVYGVDLPSGTNGVFGLAPFGTNEYETKVKEMFNGTFTDEIYDLDNIKLDVIIDANYPEAVKTAIENLVMFREDCFFFCDFGLDVFNYESIESLSELRAKTKFSALYHNSYDVVDPYSKKQIKVTICYDIASLLVNHFNNGRIRPFAGQLYGIVFNNAIEGTINFIPKLTPSINQKEMMNELRVNYATYYDGVLTLDSEYTSQEKLTDLSYVNNILGIQEVVKAIRTRCPQIRYSFMDAESLEKYKEDVEMQVLSKYTSNFALLELIYTGDKVYEANKIFYASIRVAFRDFVQTEIFDVYAIRI